MFTEDSVEAVKRVAQCHEVISDYMHLQKSGNDYKGLCVFHNERSPSFSIDIQKNHYKCFGCGVGGDALNFIMEHLKVDYRTAVQTLAQKYNIHLEEQEDNNKKEYIKPVWKNNTDINPHVVQWFEARKISQKTLERLQITSGVESMYLKGEGKWQDVMTMQFNYFRDGELVNVKYRNATKDMKLSKGAELIFYNLDSLKGATECFITEGCPDVAALVEAGYWKEGVGVVSVPNGANVNANNLSYVDNCFDAFEHIEKIYLAVDNDTAGRKLREDLAERFGKDRCYYIEWGDKKDANEVLVAKGVQGVIDCCSKPKEFEMEGCFTVSHYSNEIDDMYVNGLDRGVSFRLDKFAVRFVTGYLWVFTGIPGHGKSQLVDELTARLIRFHGFKGAYYSPENKPTKLHFSKMASRFIGKSWDGKVKITPEEKELVKNYLDKKVWFIKPEKDFSVQSIMNTVKDLKKRHGIKWFVIDAWNKLEHKGGKDNSYIGNSLDALGNFCENENVTCFLVAHPTKMEEDKKGKLKVPGAYNISGSADFYNKPDVIISVYLNHSPEGKPLDVEIHRQKIKFNHWGFKGVSRYEHDDPSGRYYSKEKGIEHTNWITNEVNKDRLNEPDTVFVKESGMPQESIDKYLREIENNNGEVF